MQKRDLIVEPLARRARRVQANQTENVFTEHHRHNEQRASAETCGEISDLLVQARGGDVVEPDRFSEIDVFGKLFQVERNNCSQTRRHVVRRAPLVTDAQFARRLQLNHVAAINVHHAAEFGDDHVQEAVEIDGVRQSHREAIDNPLARLVHFDLAF